jgi:hypothetical protein
LEKRIKALEILEKEDKKDQSTTDNDQSKDIEDLKKMLSAFGAKMNQLKDT